MMYVVQYNILNMYVISIIICNSAFCCMKYVVLCCSKQYILYHIKKQLILNCQFYVHYIYIKCTQSKIFYKNNFKKYSLRIDSDSLAYVSVNQMPAQEIEDCAKLTRIISAERINHNCKCCNKFNSDFEAFLFS